MGRVKNAIGFALELGGLLLVKIGIVVLKGGGPFIPRQMPE